MTRGNHRGVTLVEVAFVVVLVAVLAGMALMVSSALNRQSKRAFDALSQAQEATLLLENIRLELASMVMNPTDDARHHENNSFILSYPNRTSIQFVTERREGNQRKRFLVYYEASGGRAGLRLKKTVWEFKNMGTWNDRIAFPAGWPAAWIGPVVEELDTRFASLDLADIQWSYLVPDENEGRVFFRVKLALRAPGGARLIPFSTLVAVTTPDLPAQVADCPCLFAACYDPAKRNGDCCTAGEAE